MYIGIDFLIDKDKNIYLSEVNTGLPGGAREYDLICRTIFGEPSDVFNTIERISREAFKKPFKNYLRELPYFNDLKTLKIWMDGKGSIPQKPFSKFLRLEDKWVQYLILKDYFPVIPSELFTFDNKNNYEKLLYEGREFILKRRLGRGGAGFIELKNLSQLDSVLNMKLTPGHYLIQPFIDSNVTSGKKIYKMSIRVIVFAKKFICMFANLSSRPTSNHGIRFYINPSNIFGLKDNDFTTVHINEKAWEGEIFYGKNIPPHLYHNLYEEEIAETMLYLPKTLYKKIKETAVSVGYYYFNLDPETLPACILD